MGKPIHSKAYKKYLKSDIWQERKRRYYRDWGRYCHACGVRQRRQKTWNKKAQFQFIIALTTLISIVIYVITPSVWPAQTRLATAVLTSILITTRAFKSSKQSQFKHYIHLHHMSYVEQRLHPGNEPDEDLVPLCGVHHSLVHQIHKSGRFGFHNDSLRLATLSVIQKANRRRLATRAARKTLTWHPTSNPRSS